MDANYFYCHVLYIVGSINLIIEIFRSDRSTFRTEFNQSNLRCTDYQPSDHINLLYNRTIMTVLGCCCNEKLKNVLIISFVMCLTFSALYPAGAVQNIALEETSDIPLTVGYYSAIIQNIGSMVTALVFQFLCNRLGLKLTVGLATILVTGSYWPMIWITNQYVIYAGEFLSGIGRGEAAGSSLL